VNHPEKTYFERIDLDATGYDIAIEAERIACAQELQNRMIALLQEYVGRPGISPMEVFGVLEYVRSETWDFILERGEYAENLGAPARAVMFAGSPEELLSALRGLDAQGEHAEETDDATNGNGGIVD
jgi:hypothetical protein